MECVAKLENLFKDFRKHSPLKETRFIIGVGSGKGGVGKTTLSVLLALALKEEGFSVGLFDLDFYGPNTLLLLDASVKTPFISPEGYQPVNIQGIKAMSLSILVSEKEPIFMRGLMAGKLLQELTKRVLWGPLDFLILDLPPGTGDIFLNTLDLFEPDGFLLVSTAHKLSLADTLRTISILKEKKVPLLGIVKNMSGLFKSEDSFQNFLDEVKVPLIFEMPFLEELSEKESLTEIMKSEKYKELLSTLGKRVLKKVFRFY
ncbi:MAG: P-loop NTPase [Caldimicrobium sp.]